MKFFLNENKCSCCQGWRLCLGKYSENAAASDGCGNFFSELLTVSEQYKDKKNNRVDIWQL